MRHQKRSHRYSAREFTKGQARELGGADLPERLADAVKESQRRQLDPYADLPHLGLGYGLSAHMRDMNLERKWQVVGADVVERRHRPSEAELLREATRTAECLLRVQEARAKRVQRSA